MTFEKLVNDFVDTCAEAKSQTGTGKVQYAFSIVDGDILIELNDQKQSRFVFTIEHAKRFVANAEFANQFIDDNKFIEFIRGITKMLRMYIDIAEGYKS
jgi:hypothetical protein